ncbi:MAG: hypothetical protein Q4G27_09995 [Flavobacteriaceae bacterium]|nr:hypothetical protein [Flavobacteriaceae bacterium]
MKFILAIVCCFMLSISKAQEVDFKDFTAYYLFNVGYTYQNINYFEGGLNAYLVQPNDNIIDLGLTANMGYSNKNFIIYPELQAGYLWNLKKTAIDPYSSNFNSAFWVIRSSISPWHITPEAGITIVSLIDITAGYGFEFRKNEKVDLEGFKFGISLRLPFLLFWHE